MTAQCPFGTSLRGKAPKWHEFLKRIGVQLNNFAAFTTAFLESFALARTACSPTIYLYEVKQQSTEDVGFYAHVISIIDD
jgi:hypothetical protein